MKPTLSVAIPALNEEAHIAQAVAEAIRAVEGRCSAYELILFDDGSTDRTGQKMEELARSHPNVRVIHHAAPENTGAIFREAIGLARHDHLIMVPGDNENPSESLIGPIGAIGSADIVIPYPVNPSARSLTRRFLSKTYTMLLNLLFGLRLRYYNGTCIWRTADLRGIEIRSDSFGYMAEVLVKLLRKGRSFVEVGVETHPKPGRRSKAFRMRNVVGVAKALGRLSMEIYF